MYVPSGNTWLLCTGSRLPSADRSNGRRGLWWHACYAAVCARTSGWAILRASRCHFLSPRVGLLYKEPENARVCGNDTTGRRRG